MNLINFALNMLAPKAWVFEESTRDPRSAQKCVLFKYLARNKNTEYGRKYDFLNICSVKDYQAKVPMTDYEAIRPLIDRIAKGESNVITSDKVVFFGITSGTTGCPKLIPVTEYSRSKNSSLMKLWAYYINKEHPRVFSGKILSIISPEVKNFTEGGIPYGPEDGHAYNNLPLPIRSLYVLPYQVFYISDYDARYYAILRIAMEQDVTTVATLNPSTISLLCERIPRVQNAVIDDIEKGTLNKDINIPADIRKVVEKRLKPNPKRARELRAILEKNGKLLPKYFWPHMELVECWKGGTVKLYLKELPQYLGETAFRDFGYLSTEARSSVPLDDIGASSVLAVNTNFYEFIPREDIHKPNKRILLCDELEKGKEYVVIVTTPSGLCRYNIDDVIIVNGFFNKTPMIEFVQKAKNAISLTGEKIYESHINDSVNTAADKHGISADFFSSSVQMDNPPRYIFLVEFSHEPSRAGKMAFLKCIEEELCKENSEYKDIREQQLLGHPILKVVKKGEFEKYRARKISEGRHDGQFKMPQLVSDASFQKNFTIEEEIMP
ncbi:MAG: GH3 auxin-responsive promoter family protein [Candidatus Omnitrophota bacterium]|jgi:hypothetical protein